MATRVHLPSITLATLRETVAWRPELPDDRRTLAWQLATAPWWVWSDLPKPDLPVRNPSLPAGGLAGNWVVNGLDRIITRVWTQRAIAMVVRGMWLTLLIGCFWLVVDVLGGPALEIHALAVVGIILFACSLVVAVCSRPTRMQVARMLDRSFGLQERVSTALGNIGAGVPAEGEQAGVVYLQVADAANAITATRTHPAFRFHLPARELVMGIALALAFAALTFARSTGGAVPRVQDNVVPEFVPAAQRFVQTEVEPVSPNAQNMPSVADVQQMVQTSIDNQADLQALADALSDHAITRAAADLIDQGKYSEAAEELRGVSAQADQLSESARQDLADDLSQAASQMSEGNQTLSGATQQAADGLREGGDSAKTGVRGLANAVEQSGQQVQSSETLDQAMQQAQQQDASSSAQDQSQDGQQSPSQQSDSQAAPEASNAPAQGAGQPGETESTSGAEADSGLGQDPDSSSGQPGEGAPAPANSAGESSQPPGSGEQQQPQDGSASGQSSQQSDQPPSGENANPSQGSGAGGESDGSEPEWSDTGSGGVAKAPPSGKAPSQAQVSDANETSTDTSGATQDPHQAVELSRAPEGESVQIGGNSGGSSLGPGAGVTVSGGSSTQGEVGQSGPDSNHVPPEYRSIVESYFSDKDNGG